MANSMLQDTAYDTAIALVGMSGRFPGAQSVEAFWHNLAAGVASIRVFSAEELLAAGLDPALLAQPNYVKAGTVLEGIADFDASFFGFTPREAQVMDPQHRLFLECSWEALERAAYDPRSYTGLIGVFAGSAFNSYLVHHLYPQKELWETVGQLQMDVGNERDSLASTVSYKLNLRGPSLAVQTFCSTSLVAVHLASQSLLNYECDLALAGGVALATQQPRGYLYEEGGILSPDGHCRSFDARAQGSVMGSGVGVVVLKRLREALQDGDNILAVLRGSAINNDGSTRVSYTAPGVEGQASVIAAALSYGGVAPESISYIETHGTATSLGDAVEVAAMKKVFGASSADGPWCTLGSLKPNVGHLDRASGVTGLIKTALALSHEQLPPNLDYEQSNAALALEQSPFQVNTQLRAWPRSGQPRRAGVSSFGLGGTNAHVVLEEAPGREAGSASRPWHLLLLSARSPSALEVASDNLLRHLQEHPELEMADVAYTLQVGRSAFHQRRMLVCQNRDDAITALSSRDIHRVHSSTLSHRDFPVAFLFSGPGMKSLSGLRELYHAEHTFREAVDHCCDRLLPLIGQDLRIIIQTNTVLPSQIEQMQHVHLYSFILEYALAQVYISWGIRPQFLFGVGTGEYVAACLANVFSLEDALKIVSTQAMVASRMPATSTNQYPEAMANVLDTVTLSAPQIPTISSVTGSWLTAEQATDALYWSMLPETPVSTNEGIRNLLAKKGCVLLEIGTEQSFPQALKQQMASFDQEVGLLISIQPEQEEMGWHAALLTCLGQLWLAGVFIDWANFYAHERRLRVLLPTYPFERKRYWIEDPRVQRFRDEQHANSSPDAGEENVKKADIAHWFYRPTWKQAPFSAPSMQLATENDAAYLVFCDACGLGVQLAARLREEGKTVICVQTGPHFAQLNEHTFMLNPGHAADYYALSQALAASHRIPYTLIHCWTISSSAITSTDREPFAAEQEMGLYSLFYVTQAFSSQWSNELVHLLVVSNGLHAITDRETVQPEKMTVLGACKVIPQEHLNIICRNLDLALPVEDIAASSGSVDVVLQELNATSGERVVAYRHEQRWVQTYEPVELPQPHVSTDALRQHGVYLIVGGLGSVGVVLAEHLAKSVQARLILVGRTALPPRDEWSDWLTSHDENNIIAQKIRRVQYLETLGAQILILQADAAEETGMQRVIGQAQAHFGMLHGVIYAAAVSQPEAFTVVQQMSREICDWHFQSKVYGLYTLEHVLQDVPLDFCVLFSSISSILGGLGFGGYVAGNLFMDAFVHRHNQQQGSDTQWLSVNWDTWQIRPEGHNGLGGSVARYAMSKEEGLAVFDRLLARQALPQLIISTGDLQARIRQWVLLESVQSQVEAAVADRAATVPLGKEYEELLIAIWQQVLGIEQVGLYDNFFDLGGNSLSALQVIARMRKVFGTQIPVVALFEAPTISTLVRYLRPEVEKSVSESARLYHELEQRRVQVRQESEPEGIAIIGMSGRFPGAATLEQFWQNLSDGVESITFFKDEELLAAGVDKNELRDPAYVKARPILTPEQVECFDAAFFGYSPREAELMDPQHRLFLECCWEALEHGGYDPLTYQGLIGVFGGANISSYLHSLLKQPELLASLQEVVNEYQAVIGMDKDSLTTGVSYKLNLKGPSFAVQTFCSTSLVAVHLACQSLRTGECNLALAGGVSIRVPYKTGHLYEPGGMESPDGHCRTFDAQARGSMIGDGVGLVVLKRLAEALQDGDTIHAVIKGSAINNDGSLKVSYTAPSVTGQAEVVKTALANAGVDAESIDYIEAHGTATELGDPIEIASLTKAFRTQTDRQGYCAIGSVKTNIGHLDRAAGVSGLIKTVLALENEELPASLHYATSNPQIDFAQSPFYVNTQRTPWKRNGKTRRAGVSSLGMGGTNAHVIVEEAPPAYVSSPSRPWQLLLLSAKTPTALETATTNLAHYLEQHTDTALADAAYTLQVGRSTFQHRRVVVCNDRLDAVQALKAQETTSLWTAYQERRDQGVAFLFPDMSAWCASVTQELYDREPTFQAAIDACCSILKQRVGLDLLKVLYTEQAERNIEHTNQLATFAIEYALAQLLIEWGVRPQTLLGHGVGEYVAACIADVFSLEDALMLVIAAREKRSALALSVRFSAPKIPCVISGTGTWITPEQATDPNYWSQRVSQSDRLANGIERLLHETDTVLVEIGPGESLCAAVKQHSACTSNRMAQVFATLPMSHEQQSEQCTLLALLGKLWLAGVSIAWTGFHAHERRQRIPLPTYPFERQRYWLGSPPQNQSPVIRQMIGKPNNKRDEIPSWFYEPQWQQVALPVGNAMQETAQKTWLVFLDDCGVGQQLIAHLLQYGHTVVCVQAGEQLAQLDATHFTLRPANPADYTALLHMLQTSDMFPGRILHCWSISSADDTPGNPVRFAQRQETGFYSVLYLAKALGQLLYDETVQFFGISSDIHLVTGREQVQAEKAPIVGACKVISQEYSTLSCRCIDIEPQFPLAASAVEALIAECLSPVFEPVVAYRESVRWVQTYQAYQMQQPQTSTGNQDERHTFRQDGVYLITGGLGNIGLLLASYLGQTYRARLVLTGRTAFPSREQWETWLEQHDDSNSVSQIIRQLRMIEAHGGQVLLIQADVANEEQMQAAIQQTLTTFGTLHGVLHAAGLPSGNTLKPVETISYADCETQFQAKVYGLITLEKVLKHVDLDFCLLFSSLSAVLGGLSFVAYAAANLFLDASVYQHNQLGTATRWLSINWDTWQVKEDAHGVLGDTIAAFAMTPREACAALEYALTTSATHLVNSTGDLHARLVQWVLLDTLRESFTGEEQSHEGRSIQWGSGDELEQRVTEVWQQVLGLSQVGREENFFDLGGNSLMGLQLIARLKKTLRISLPIVALFEAPTIALMVRYLQPQTEPIRQTQRDILKQRRHATRTSTDQHEIAIIGMSGRFPGAATIERFWQNLSQGRESITFFSDEELLAAGVDPTLLKASNYVKARPVLDQELVEHFDASFFGYSPREAELTDPQHRLFLECSWEALEQAGYAPHDYEGLIGVFGGTNISTYILAQDLNQLAQVNTYQLLAGNDKDSLTSTVSYKLNLHGPSFAVQTFCSTSLVAAHLACQSLRNGECDIALAGGVSIRVPAQGGHLYEEGGMESPDGHCRTFDIRAKGSMFGDGAGVVVLKRLSDALMDGDTIHAVIKGSAVNNDGSLKVSYSAPSVTGQSEVITQALADADVHAESISYVEAHGTATELGDPIEVAALAKAFRTQTDRQGYCAIGSVKTNVGHLDRASGISGLIKTVLALKHEALPASLHFEQPNPQIDFAHSPFYVNTQLRPWLRGEHSRRAGINSLGMGGTNVHMIVEEAPIQVPSGVSRPWQILLLSARTETALETTRQNISTYLQQQPAASLADVAYTLQVGRKRFEQRCMLVCSNRQEAIDALRTLEPARTYSRFDQHSERSVAFLLPGIGELYEGLAQDLYRQEVVFREAVDRCCDLLKNHLTEDLRTLLFSPTIPGAEKNALASLERSALSGRNGTVAEKPARLNRTDLAQPATFVIEYALAQLLMHWGIRPQAMLGYSLGEYVAACLSGVFSLEDALLVVAKRAQWIQALPAGAMLAVALSERDVQAYLNEQISLAAVNDPTTCTVAGSLVAIARLEAQLLLQNIAYRSIDTTHAFHSAMLHPLRDALTKLVGSIQLHAPEIPYLSNVTGTWITAEQATDPAYWAQHMCQTVRFGEGVGHVLQETEHLLLEVGAGQALSSFAKQHPACERERMYMILPTLPSIYEQQPSQAFLLATLGKLWSMGVPIDWTGFYSAEQRRRVALPTYPFERKRYWLEPKKRAFLAQNTSPTTVADELPKIANPDDWFYVPSWKQSLPGENCDLADHLAPLQCWLLFVDAQGIGAQIGGYLRCQDQRVVMVMPGEHFARLSEDTYVVQPDQRADYDALFSDLNSYDFVPQRIVHLWTVGSQTQISSNVNALNVGFYSLLALAQALGDCGGDSCSISVVSNGVQNVTGNEAVDPVKATILGPCRVMPQEYATLRCRSIDIGYSGYSWQQDAQIQTLLEEIIADRDETVIALRGDCRWVPTYEPVQLPGKERAGGRLRNAGVYLITGGLGGIGLATAEHLARTVHAKLALVGRTALPPRSAWPQVLADSEHSTTTGIGRQIRAIQQLEALGANVLVLPADVTDEVQMGVAIQQTLDRFGALHGVLHCAGVPGEGLMQLKTPAMAARVLAPKLEGTLVLEQTLHGLPLDFLVLFSSVTSITGGGPGQVDYCAANAFLDAYARCNAHKHGLTVAIDWGEWQWNAWEAGLAGYGTEAEAFMKENRQRFGISFAEGNKALQRILSSRLPQVVVSTQDFRVIAEQSRSFTAAEVLRRTRALRNSVATHPRPDLASSYSAPHSELEQSIAATWEELLGIAAVGIHDNFFELGGNSLIGLDLIARLKKKSWIPSLPAYVLYEAPTVSTLAQYIERMRAGNVEEDEALVERHGRGEKRREGLKQRMHEIKRTR